MLVKNRVCNINSPTNILSLMKQLSTSTSINVSNYIGIVYSSMVLAKINTGLYRPVVIESSMKHEQRYGVPHVTVWSL